MRRNGDARKERGILTGLPGDGGDALVGLAVLQQLLGPAEAAVGAAGAAVRAAHPRVAALQAPGQLAPGEGHVGRPLMMQLVVQVAPQCGRRGHQRGVARVAPAGGEHAEAGEQVPQLRDQVLLVREAGQVFGHLDAAPVYVHQAQVGLGEGKEKLLLREFGTLSKVPTV